HTLYLISQTYSLFLISYTLFLSHITQSGRFLPLEMRFQLRNGSDSAIRDEIDISKEL
ncbi:hypothetical protein GIB67_042034, partial [Kingdonia uniflora]